MPPLRPSQPAVPRRCAIAVAAVLGLTPTLAGCATAPEQARETSPAATIRRAAPTRPPQGTTHAAQPGPAPPFIRHARWADRAGTRALQVAPTPSGRRASPTALWEELLRRVPDAATPGMREQLWCHRVFAPDKDSWNLEPARPVVPAADMVRAQCNPGRPADPDVR